MFKRILGLNLKLTIGNGRKIIAEKSWGNYAANIQPMSILDTRCCR